MMQNTNDEIVFLQSKDTYEPYKIYRISHYIRSIDGTKIALDAYLPADQDNNPSNNKFPTIIICRREPRRTWHFDNTIQKFLNFVKQGYVLVVLELRGCGVSFGVNDSFGSKEHCEDIASAINWIRHQAWSDGKVGMQGGSNRAYYQLCTISRFPKCLDALTIQCAVPDFYYNNYPNGVSALPSICFGEEKHDKLTKEEFLKKNSPVDEDPDGTIAYQAYIKDQFPNNHDFFKWLLIQNQNRDSSHPRYKGEQVNLTLPPVQRLSHLRGKERFNQLQLIGQFEPGFLDQMNEFQNFGGHVIIGPWDHIETLFGNSKMPEGSINFIKLMNSWFDWSLKQKDNGFDQMPPIIYYMINAKDGEHWRVSDTWPLENEVRTKLYLCDNNLTLQKPNIETKRAYQARSDTIPFLEHGKSCYSRMHLQWEGDMRTGIDSRALTYTTKPLWFSYDNEMAGCITADFWLDCNQKDVDIIVYAEEVLSDGTSHYIKDGMIRASHRTEGRNLGWEKMGAVWHTSMTKDVEKCLDEGMEHPVHIRFAIDPICYRFQPGSRFRISITCSNTVACQHMYDPNNMPLIHVYEGGEHASFISIPFLEREQNVFHGLYKDRDAILYVFKEHLYLNVAGTWKRFERSEYGSLYNEFRMYGVPIKNSIFQYENHREPFAQPLPYLHGCFVAKVPVPVHDRYLFVPSEKTLQIDLYKKTNHLYSPCILYVHGYNSPYNKIPTVLTKLLNKGFSVACIDMRDYPPAQFPEPIFDIKGCIRWIRANAEHLGIDPMCIGIFGNSFGGNASLLAAVTEDDPALEGSIGGNIQYSSSVQAAVAGFAWSDLLNMGPDIAGETFNDEVLRTKRLEMTDGENSPGAEIIGFAGKGKGLKVLREADDSNPQIILKRQEASRASAINRIGPGMPPILVYGGYGEPGVNIAFAQSVKTFSKLAQYDNPAHITGNTKGGYTNNPENLAAIESFFERYLKEYNDEILILAGDKRFSFRGYQPIKVSTLKLKDNSLFIFKSELEKLLGTHIDGNDTIDLFHWNYVGFSIQVWKSHHMVIIRKISK